MNQRKADVADPLWVPGAGVRSTRLAHFTRWLEDRHGRRFPDYHCLWRWSVTELGQFWADIAEYFGIVPAAAAHQALAVERMPGAVWFPDLEVNFAAQVLSAFEDDAVVLVAADESGAAEQLTGAEVRRQVHALAQTLRSLGVRPGDRVAGYLPNTPHAVVAFLAASSIGAVWTVCAPDFGVRSVLDRLAQTAPKVLIAADGYHYGGQIHRRANEAMRVLDGLPGPPECIWVSYVDSAPGPRAGLLSWEAATAGVHEPCIERVPFDHPLWILYSSGTTGVPKGIVHSHGGVLLEQLKMLGLLTDVRRGDTFFWYTSTAWMMWNVVVSSLLLGARAVLYDGSPRHPDLTCQWRLVERHQITHFGTSAGYLAACAKDDVPTSGIDLGPLRYIGSTGSPLPASTARWIYDKVLSDVHLASSSGGTDVASGFAAGAPTLPVWAGEISGPALGVALDSFDEAGNAVRGRDGELVVTRPMPSMPIYFWNDPDGTRYRDTYFSTYDGVWRHGDWIEITERGTAIISGRSDSTLNRGGVRMGTADVYSALTAVPEVVDSMMLGVELDGGGYWMPLFVQLADGVTLDHSLEQAIRDVIARRASRRHVPDEVISVPGIPYTRTGKRLEVPIKRLLQGRGASEVMSPGGVADPALIAVYQEIAAAYSARARAARAATHVKRPDRVEEPPPCQKP